MFYFDPVDKQCCFNISYLHKVALLCFYRFPWKGYNFHRLKDIFCEYSIKPMKELLFWLLYPIGCGPITKIFYIPQIYMIWQTWNIIVCSCHATYAFQIESILYSCLNIKELLARSRPKIWSLSDCNWIWTRDHLVHEWTLNHVAKLASLAKWLSVRLRTKCLWGRVQLQSHKIWYLPFVNFIALQTNIAVN